MGKTATKAKQEELDLDLEDLDLDDLDIEDLEELDVEDEVEEEDEPEAEEDDGLDLEADDEDEDEEEDEDDDDELDLDDEVEDAADDDDLDLEDDEDEEDEPEPAPRKRKRAPAKADAPASDKPISDAQRALLAKAVKSKRDHAKVVKPGQVRTAQALVDRKLAKFESGTDKGFIQPTAKGRKEIEKGSTSSKPATTRTRKPAAKPAASRRGAPSGPRKLPRGRYGIAQVAKACKQDEPTVRRVLALNEDQFSKENGRWIFDKEGAKALADEVKAYVKYTGGRRGRPKGSKTTLPEGKVGVDEIAQEADVHPQTVYKFLQEHADKLGKYKVGSRYAFTQKQASQVAEAILKRGR